MLLHVSIFFRVKKHLFGATDDFLKTAGLAVIGQQEQQNKCCAFLTDGWKKLEEAAASLKLDFTICSLMAHFVARKEGDGIPADNFRSISSQSFKFSS